MRSTANRRAMFSVILMAALPSSACGNISGAARPATSALASGSNSAPTYEIALEEAWIPMPDWVRLAADGSNPLGSRLAKDIRCPSDRP